MVEGVIVAATATVGMAVVVIVVTLSILQVSVGMRSFLEPGGAETG